jgi:L-threonylcarbamoyladenylate synthase
LSPESIVCEAVKALRCGHLVVYPTETFYGIGADAWSASAVDLMFQVKNREAGKPVALIAADLEMAFSIASEIPALARTLAARFWPGPLTMVLLARAGLHPGLISSEGGVGVRVSSHPLASRLSKLLGRPVTASSANLAGQPPARSIEQARAMLADKVKVYVEGGRSAAQLPSTVVGFERATVRIIRPGAITAAAIEQALPARVRE